MIFDVHHPEFADAVAVLSPRISVRAMSPPKPTYPSDCRPAEGSSPRTQTWWLPASNCCRSCIDKVDRCISRKSERDCKPGGDRLASARLARTLLTRERVALNFLQRLSGVATLARNLRRCKCSGTGCRILDTRKTTPGLRRLEKSPLRPAALNHRMGLFDAILIKNNHITAAGGVARPCGEACENEDVPVEIEVRTRAETRRSARSAEPNRLLLDNLTPAEAADGSDIIAGRATVELSGGIDARERSRLRRNGRRLHLLAAPSRTPPVPSTSASQLG